MGQDKASMRVGNRPLAGIVADSLAPFASEVLLAGAPVPGVEGRVVLDPSLIGGGAYGGPVAGLVAALGAARTPYLVAAACDMPALVIDLVVHLVRRLDAEPGALAALCQGSNRLEPFPIALRTRALRPLRAAFENGVQAVRDAVGVVRAVIVEPPEWSTLDPDGRSFVNWNVPEDVRQPPRPRPTIAPL